MNAQINQLVKSLLQKDSLEQCSVEELQQFADRHPYFGAAQLLLTKKLQTENPEQYEEQLQKTFLFFHNPLWVEHLLNDTGNATVVETETNENIAKAGDTFTETSEINEAVIPIETAMPAVLSSTHEEAPPDTPLPVLIADGPVTAEETDPADLIQAPGFQPEPIDVAASDCSKNELLFEPFHTVDYFASQGIKFKEEEKPKDKFGQQLKSFTDWLKTMKRLPVTEMIQSVQPNAELKVEQLAQHSLQEGEVLTEAMAEVWEKQGNPVKAIDIYSKLSLLDPSKKRYFAAKIEELKKLN